MLAYRQPSAEALMHYGHFAGRNQPESVRSLQAGPHEQSDPLQEIPEVDTCL